MILADTELARRVDCAEARLMQAVAGLTAQDDPAAGAFALPIGSGIAVYAGPHSPSNKLIGAGFDGAPSEDLLGKIEQAYFERSSGVQAEVSVLACPQTHELFARRGYVPQGFENVLGKALTDTDCTGADGGGVEVAATGSLESWMDTVITGFEYPDATGAGSIVAVPPREAIERAFRQTAGTPGFQAYDARVGGELAGGGALRVDEGIAQLCGAATLPAYRRMGIQAALLRRRLSDARKAGCDLAVMTAQPGSKSHFNAQRQGFSLLYSRAILVKSPPV